MKIYFTKEELANNSKEELQEKVNEYAKLGLVPLNSTVADEPFKPSKIKPVVYMTKNMWEGFQEMKDDGNIVGLLMFLELIVQSVDDDTMKRIQRLVESEETSTC